MPSPYGQGNYGKGLYSAADTWALTGNLAPAFSFSGHLIIPAQPYLAGNLAPHIILSGHLGISPGMRAGMTIQITLRASGMISGPLWVEEPPCGPVDWAPAELCNG